MSKPLAASSLLILATLACAISLGGPKPPGDPIPVSKEAADELKHIWESATLNPVDGEIQVILTEEQLTSYVALRLAADPDPLIQDPQVYLRDDQIQVYGDVRNGNFTAKALVKLLASVDPDGKPDFAVTEADFGPLPVPKALLSALSVSLNEAFTGQFGTVATGIKITTLAIANGEMAIVGRLR